MFGVQDHPTPKVMRHQPAPRHSFPQQLKSHHHGHSPSLATRAFRVGSSYDKGHQLEVSGADLRPSMTVPLFESQIEPKWLRREQVQAYAFPRWWEYMYVFSPPAREIMIRMDLMRSPSQRPMVLENRRALCAKKLKELSASGTGNSGDRFVLQHPPTHRV